MQYVSTRNTQQAVSAAQAIAKGIAQDGGLFCPATIPTLTDVDWQTLKGLRYHERAALILSKFLTEWTEEELLTLTKLAYANGQFDSEAVAPIKALKDNTYVLELWHGPTCAFKDMALQLLPHLLTSSLRKTGETRTACILVATSGDTGKAALEGFANVPGTKMMVYYPVDGVSAVQKLQMITQRGENVSVCAIRGNFDDAQSAVKQIFTDASIAQKLEQAGMFFSSANSINWGRLVPQIVYYISAYCDLIQHHGLSFGSQVDICVPTGNFGNLLAAYYAKQMGLPVRKFVCASNQNRVLTDFFETGTYDRNRTFYTTTSPSMDILISSNIERLLYLLSEGDDGEVRAYMVDLAQKGTYTVSDALRTKMGQEFAAGSASDAQAGDCIRTLWQEQGYLIDPHTAVAMHVAQAYQKTAGNDVPMLVASTASPYKFADSVLTALGQTATDAGTKLLYTLQNLTGMPIPPSLAELNQKPVRFDKVVDRTEMMGTLDWLLA